ncbi:menaquinone biosynthesis protein [Sediminibacterium sp.]|uniref:menaquinone biosynthetic enzyme MqnA/MqnD family protein n=1 Tax=Sediminibacterium sp. TaxID=1917865 RepID=UPI0025FE887E|nr:menaquinone biosynthesis protein [Sediminibacterium sp.]MBW0178430.1 menaquinone biosynthesis protein [Sediminibacterium sp.]
MDKRLRIGAVSYLNTRPMMYGVQRSGLMQKVALVADFPAKIAAMLLNDEIDIGLVPVAIIPRLKEAHIITHYCIGAVGRVESVGIFSEVPLEQVEKLILDYQSRTSVNLARILLKEYWKKEVAIEQAEEDYRHLIKGSTAAVVIGNRALVQHKKSAYYYDLSEAWQQHTGLPFVFAAWVANKPVDPDFEDAFNRANAYGINHIDEVVDGLDFPDYDLKKYYTQHISYTFDEEKRKGLELFLQKLTQL